MFIRWKVKTPKKVTYALVAEWSRYIKQVYNILTIFEIVYDINDAISRKLQINSQQFYFHQLILKFKI